MKRQRPLQKGDRFVYFEGERGTFEVVYVTDCAAYARPVARTFSTYTPTTKTTYRTVNGLRRKIVEPIPEDQQKPITREEPRTAKPLMKITRTMLQKTLAKRPWNASLKTLCWKLGESFKKVSGLESDIYGKIYRERKALEVSRNEEGLFESQAEEALRTRNIRDKELKATYKAGRLPAGRLDLRATRRAVKIFLSHLQHVMYETKFGKAPPKPYILTRPEHAHYLAPPNWPCE